MCGKKKGGEPILFPDETMNSEKHKQPSRAEKETEVGPHFENGSRGGGKGKKKKEEKELGTGRAPKLGGKKRDPSRFVKKGGEKRGSFRKKWPDDCIGR